jgi:hypothetical protein
VLAGADAVEIVLIDVELDLDVVEIGDRAHERFSASIADE